MNHNWNSNIYAQERSILKLTGIARPADEIAIEVQGALSGITASYSLYYTGGSTTAIDIDMTDLVRLALSGTFYVWQNYNGAHLSSPLQLTWTRKGLINPERDIIPDFECRGGDWSSIDCKVAPPEHVISDYGNTQILEMFANIDAAVYVWLRNGQFVSTAFDASTNKLTLPWNWARYVVYNTDTDEQVGNEIVGAQPSPDAEYVLTRWTSRYGFEKRFVIEIRDVKRATTETVSLETIDGTPDVRKGYELTAVLHLEGLTAYDMWYYGDIVTSQSVEVYWGGALRKVEVLTKDYGTPNTDAGAANELNIEIKLTDYDAV